MRNLIASLFVLLVAASSAADRVENETVLLEDVCVATGSAPGECGDVYFEIPEHTRAYFMVRTTAKTGSPTITCELATRLAPWLYAGAGRAKTCTMTAITTETTRVAMIGEGASTGEGIDDACPLLLPGVLHYQCVFSGSGSMTVDAVLALLVNR